MRPTDIESFTAAQFKLADTDGDGCISYEEFVAYYGHLATSRACQELRTALGPQAESEPALCCCDAVQKLWHVWHGHLSDRGRWPGRPGAAERACWAPWCAREGALSGAAGCSRLTIGQWSSSVDSLP